MSHVTSNSQSRDRPDYHWKIYNEKSLGKKKKLKKKKEREREREIARKKKLLNPEQSM